MIQRAKMGTNGIFLGKKGNDRHITFCFKWQLFQAAPTPFTHNTDISCLPVCLWRSTSVFVSPSSEQSFIPELLLCLKSSVNWWSCCSESGAFKPTEHSPRSPSNAFTRISPIYKAYAHLQTHSPHPFKSNAEQWREARLESGEEESGVA